MKTVCLLCLFCCGVLLNAQAQRRIHLTPVAGLNMTNYYGKDARDDDAFKPGFHIGGRVSTELLPFMDIQAGLLFSTKGVKYTNEDPSNMGLPDDSKTTYYGIDLPIHVLYKRSLGPGQIVAGVGPFVSYALSAKYKYNGSTSSLIFSKTYYRRWDVGASALVGYALQQKYSIQVSYNPGFINLQNQRIQGFDEIKIRHTGFRVSFGYTLR